MSRKTPPVDERPARDPPQSSRRTSSRVHVSIPVLCEPAQGETFGGTMVDVGFGGACIECAQAPSFGTALSIVVQLPGALGISRLPAIVRWTTSQSFGTQFGLLGARDTKLIADLIAETKHRPE